MNCSRQDWRRALDFSAVHNADTAMAQAILGLLRRRKDAQTIRDICRWFRATPEQFISATLGDMLMAGTIKADRTSLNRKRWVLEYYIEQETN